MDFENPVNILAYVSSVERSDWTEYSGLATSVLAKYDAVWLIFILCVLFLRQRRVNVRRKPRYWKIIIILNSLNHENNSSISTFSFYLMGNTQPIDYEAKSVNRVYENNRSVLWKSYEDP